MPTPKLRYAVWENEPDDSGCCTYFTSQRRAFTYMKKVLRKPPHGVTSVSLVTERLVVERSTLWYEKLEEKNNEPKDSRGTRRGRR